MGSGAHDHARGNWVRRKSLAKTAIDGKKDLPGGKTKKCEASHMESSSWRGSAPDVRAAGSAAAGTASTGRAFQIRGEHSRCCKSATSECACSADVERDAPRWLLTAEECRNSNLPHISLEFVAKSHLLLQTCLRMMRESHMRGQSAATHRNQPDNFFRSLTYAWYVPSGGRLR